ncbi:18942_t:CDS:2, partial [Racocetra fulgida]
MTLLRNLIPGLSREFDPDDLSLDKHQQNNNAWDILEASKEIVKQTPES